MTKNIGVNKLKHFVPEKVMFSLYCTLILPHVNYCILVWGNAAKKYLNKIFKLQKKALRIVSDSNYRSHSAPLFQKYNQLNVFDIYNLELLTFMYKHSINLLPTVFDSYFTKQISSYNTRNEDNYILTRIKTSFALKSIRNSGPSKWNSLQKEIRNAKSAKTFRKHLKAERILHYE